MKCVVYKGRGSAGTYLFVERTDDFSRVPPALRKLLGELEHVMSLELTPQRKLAQADTAQVRRLLRAQGYYLQLPPQSAARGTGVGVI